MNTAVLSRDGIRGWRILPTSPSQLVLETKDSRQAKVKLARIFREDPEFSEWVYTLRSLDHQEMLASKAQIRNDRRLGETPGERMKALARGRIVARRLTIIGIVAVLWGLIPVEYPFAILALAVTPWIAVVAVSKSNGVLRIDPRSKDVHPGVGVPFLIPGMILLRKRPAGTVLN